ncbi:MAG: 5-formyltetrahydrofolate cyclo-ligase [Rhodobacteraceae bacterium]|nr:5-formyltetrahydrofolate cyclo-ligase [Paracoccaceae bacterium]
MRALTEIKRAARTAGFARRQLAHTQAGPGVAGHLSQVLAGYRGVALAGYMPIRTEIDPLTVMEEAAAHGVVCVPVIRAPGQALVFSRWQPGAAMVAGPFGARIPTHEELIVPEILIVPLVAFDLKGGRLGYGGGFYDRTLQGLRQQRATLAIGFAYGAQQTDDLPLEPTDQPLDMIVTEHGVHKISA